MCNVGWLINHLFCFFLTRRIFHDPTKCLAKLKIIIVESQSMGSSRMKEKCHSPRFFRMRSNQVNPSPFEWDTRFTFEIMKNLTILIVGVMSYIIQHPGWSFTIIVPLLPKLYCTIRLRNGRNLPIISLNDNTRNGIILFGVFVYERTQLIE